MIIVLVRDSSSCSQAETRAETPEVIMTVRKHVQKHLKLS